MNGRNTILTYANIALIFTFMYICFFTRLAPGNSGIEYKDLISILLTAVAVLLAAVTIVVAALAIWGYTSIRDASVKAATDMAERVAKEVAEPVATRVAREAAGNTTGTSGDAGNTADIVAALAPKDGGQ